MFVLCVYFVFFFKDTVPTPFCIYNSRNNNLVCKNIYLAVHETCQLAPPQVSCCLKGIMGFVLSSLTMKAQELQIILN